MDFHADIEQLWGAIDELRVRIAQLGMSRRLLEADHERLSSGVAHLQQTQQEAQENIERLREYDARMLHLQRQIWALGACCLLLLLVVLRVTVYGKICYGSESLKIPT